MIYNNIPELFIDICSKYSNSHTAFTYRSNGEYIRISHRQLQDKVECLAISLLELGLQKNDRIGIVAENSLNWILACFAINMIGAIDVPLFPILTAFQEWEIFNDCQAKAVFVSNKYQLNKIDAIKDTLPNLKHIICFSGNINTESTYLYNINHLIEQTKNSIPKKQQTQILDKIISNILPDDLLTIIYTSGTTGIPKGVMLTHNNLIANMMSSINSLGDFSKESSLMFLPLCHAYERTTGFYTLFYSGALINIADSIDTMSAQLLEVNPTIITAVPKLLETIKKKIFINISKESILKRLIFGWAIRIGNVKALKIQNSQNSLLNDILYKIANKLVFAKIRMKLGGKLTKVISGGAPLSPKVEMFYRAVGLEVAQGYGLTEASPVVTANRFDDFEYGTIGKPLVNVEVRLADDGEILVKGPNVMKGYWNNIKATNEALDQNGWLHTGDIAIITEKGNYKITDRKKNIFVSSGGKNIAPQPIENSITLCKYIDHCFLIGDNREYVTALIVPNFELLNTLANNLQIKNGSTDELVNNAKIISFFKNEIEFYQTNLSKFEKIRKFKILAKPFTTDTGELTPKMSYRRDFIEDKYNDLIESMYK